MCVFESDCWTLSWGIKENMAEEHHELYTSTACYTCNSHDRIIAFDTYATCGSSGDSKSKNTPTILSMFVLLPNTLVRQ